MAQYKLIHCNINGKDVEKMVDVRASLTDMLRNDYHLTSVKKGCEVGECGACNVLIDGECFNSCIYLAVWAEGPSSKVRATMGFDGSIYRPIWVPSGGSPASFPVTARRIPSTRSPWPSVPAVSPFFTRAVQAPF